MVGNSTNEHAPKHVFNNSRHLQWVIALVVAWALT